MIHSDVVESSLQDRAYALFVRAHGCTESSALNRHGEAVGS